MKHFSTVIPYVHPQSTLHLACLYNACDHCCRTGAGKEILNLDSPSPVFLHWKTCDTLSFHWPQNMWAQSLPRTPCHTFSAGRSQKSIYGKELSMSQWNKKCFSTAHKYLFVSDILGSESTKVKGLFPAITSKEVLEILFCCLKQCRYFLITSTCSSSTIQAHEVKKKWLMYNQSKESLVNLLYH